MPYSSAPPDSVRFLLWQIVEQNYKGGEAMAMKRLLIVAHCEQEVHDKCLRVRTPRCTVHARFN
jgi:hypothetical protein